MGTIKSVKFKSPHTRLEVADRVITDKSLSIETYLNLVKLNPNFRKLFEVEYISNEHNTLKHVTKKQKSAD